MSEQNERLVPVGITKKEALLMSAALRFGRQADPTFVEIWDSLISKAEYVIAEHKRLGPAPAADRTGAGREGGVGDE